MEHVAEQADRKQGIDWRAIRAAAWIVMAIWAVYLVVVRYQELLSGAKGAPQEAVAAADTAARLIFGYVLARAVDRLGELAAPRPRER